MKIRIDTPIFKHFAQVAADLDESTDRRYLACSDNNKLAILVIHEEAVTAVDYDIEKMTGKVWDCSIGNHPTGSKAAPVGFVLPRNEGLQHSKLTIRRIAEGEPDTTLSAFLDTSIEKQGTDQVKLPTDAKANYALPEQLMAAIQRIATREGVPADTIVYEALMHYVMRNL